jgi:RNA polymerase sigma factor (TIGR02999 family)
MQDTVSVTMAATLEITELLNAANSGDHEAQQAAYTLVYNELKRRADRVRRAAPGSSLTSTALVHELFVRLNSQRVGTINNRGHFYALAARAMRQIVIDHARRRCSDKRGGGVAPVDIADVPDVRIESAEQALELDAALTSLERRDADLARVVEWHFFAGLTFKEISAELGRQEHSVYHDWQLALALLQRTLSGAQAT